MPRILTTPILSLQICLRARGVLLCIPVQRPLPQHIEDCLTWISAQDGPPSSWQPPPWGRLVLNGPEPRFYLGAAPRGTMRG